MGVQISRDFQSGDFQSGDFHIQSSKAPSLCHFYQEWFIKGHYLSIREYSFVHFVLQII